MTKTLHTVLREPKIQNSAPPLLVMLHGYGSNEMDLFSFADELPGELLIVSVRAPHSTGMGGYAWYALHWDATDGKFSDLNQATDSILKLETLLNELQNTYQPSKTFLMGFSQGAILSYAISLQYPNRVQHVLALSGYINEDLLPKDIPTNLKTDYYISHGTVDQVLPVEWARKAPTLLDKFGGKNVYSEYPVGHGVAPQNFFSLKKWIEDRL